MIGSSRRWLTLTAAAVASAAPFCAPLAFAQEGGSLDEVVVTAQKREQNLQDIGVSVTALGQQQLELLGAQGMTALESQAPSLQVQTYSPTLIVFNIRGVSQNDFQDIQEAPIAFYNDEVYYSALGAIAGTTFDLERVEVLRGPQGTLFGRNATGGLVQVVTARPTDEFEAFAQLTVGSYNQVATEAYISGPLSDTVRARASITSNYNDGWIENSIGPDFNEQKFLGGRGQIEFDVGATGLLSFKLEVLRNDNEITGGGTLVAAGFDPQTGLGFPLGPNDNFYGTCGGCTWWGEPTPADPFKIDYDALSTFDRTFWSGTMRYEQDVGSVRFTSLTNYQDLEKHQSQDSDYSAVDFFTNGADVTTTQFSQEFRLSGDTERLNWVAGLYGLHIDTDIDNGFGYLPLFPLFIDFESAVETDSYAVFAQGEYALNDVFSVILGSRYGYDEKTYDYTLVYAGTPFIYEFNPQTYPDFATQDWSNYSYRLELDAHLNKDTLLYVSTNRGTKSGGFGVPLFGPTPQDTIYDEEVLTSYEAGFKTTFADNRLRLNGAIFHYDYDGYQAFTSDGISQIIRNIPAEVDGIELELTALVTSNLEVSAFVTNLFTAEAKNVGLPVPAGQPAIFADRRMPRAPEWSLGTTITYTTSVGPGDLALILNWKYNSEQYFGVFNAPVDLQPSYNVGNFRATYGVGNWQAQFFVNNLTDEEYGVYGLDSASAFGFSSRAYAPPRWVGGGLSYRF